MLSYNVAKDNFTTRFMVLTERKDTHVLLKNN